MNDQHAQKALACSSDAFFQPLLDRRDAIESLYRARTPASQRAVDRARQVFPGGFTRDAFLRKPYPVFVKRGRGPVVVDADDRSIRDFWFNATSLPLGHADPDVVAAITAQAALGTAYFAPTEHETALAEVILARLRPAERIRFTNSGSEAVMMAIRFARAHAGRSLIVKFEGSYHGSYDDVSWSVGPAVAEAGPEDAPTPRAETSGLAGTDGRVAVLPFNDLEAFSRFCDRHGPAIAAVLVEPLANRIGMILPDPAFIAAIRAQCDRIGAVLIFDEVIAFRASYGGAQRLLCVEPDLTTLGKVIGGGFPVGAVAGRAGILDRSAPDAADRVSHAGTFNANPMVAVAGLATMQRLTPQAFDTLAGLGERVRGGLRRAIGDRPLQVTGAGSLFKVTATGRSIRNYRDAATTNRRWEALASLALLAEGFLLTPTLAGCVCLATTEADVDALVETFESTVLA